MGVRKPIGIPHARFLACLAILAIGFVAGTAFDLPFHLAFVAAFDTAALVFIASTWPLWRGTHDAGAMRARAARDDGGRVLLLLLAVCITGAVLFSVVELLATHAPSPAPPALIAIVTEIIAWLFANLVYAFHYARLYFDPRDDGGDRGGIELPGGDVPDFGDFVTFALVIGMTCQTADIDITDRRIRRASTLHGLLAFFFNLGVLAITVNVVAGAL